MRLKSYVNLSIILWFLSIWPYQQVCIVDFLLTKSSNWIVFFTIERLMITVPLPVGMFLKSLLNYIWLSGSWVRVCNLFWYSIFFLKNAKQRFTWSLYWVALWAISTLICYPGPEDGQIYSGCFACWQRCSESKPPCSKMFQDDVM